MELAARPWITAGVALAGAGAIAVTPVTPTLPDVQVPDIQLAAFDVITPWVDVFNDSSTNLTNLADNYFEAPLPVLQQAIVNQAGYLGEFVHDPGSIGTIFGQIGTNLQAALGAPFAADPSLLDAMDGPHLLLENPLYILLGIPPQYLIDQFISHQFLFGLLQQGLGPNPLLDFTASPLSGLLLGAVGPVVSPLLAFGNSVQEIIGDFNGANPLGALNEMLNVPANITGAFLNGGEEIDLLSILSALGIALPSVPGLDINSVGLAMGGLLSPGSSLFNALGLNADFGFCPVCVNFDLPGHGAGPIGSLVATSQAIAQAIGWGGTGNPLTDLAFPLLPASLSALSADPVDLLGNFDLGSLGPDVAAALSGVTDVPNEIIQALVSLL